MTIDELRIAAAVVRDATEEGENTATRIGQLFLDTVNTLCNLSTNAIKGYVVISSTSDLPTSPTTDQQMKGYLLGTMLYVWVGTGGDTLDGKYQSTQLQGQQGNPGVSLGEAELVDDLTTGGHDKVLSAEQGKVLKGLVDNIDIHIVNDLTTGGEGNALSAEMGKVLNEQDKVSGSYVEGEAVTYSSSAMTFELGDIIDGAETTADNVCRSTEYFQCYGTMVCDLGLRYPGVVLYDAEKNYIRRIDPTAKPTTLKLGEAKYFRLLVKNTTKLNEAKSYGGSYNTHTWYNELCKDYVLKLLPKSGITYTSHNLYDKDNMYTDTKKVEPSTGVVSNVNMSGIATIPVVGGRIYCYDIPRWHVPLTGAQYKADGTYIGAINNVRARGGGYKFMVDTECSFIILNIYPTGTRDYSNTFALQEGEVYDETYTSYKQTMMATISQMPPAFPYNKPSYVLPIKLCVLGDSIATPTQGRWFDKLMTNFNMKSIWTLAIGKARYTHYSDSIETSNPEQNSHENIITNQVNKLIAGIEGGTYGMPDVVLIHSGINDRQDSDTGPDGDTSMYGNTTETFVTNRTIDYTTLNYGDSKLCTLVGGIRMAVELLRKNYPATRIILTTPIYTGGPSNWKVQKINKIIKECAAWLSVPVIDLTYESQIYQSGSFWTDSLHPNEVGSILMADCIGHGLQRYFGGVIMDTRKYTISGSVLSNGTPQTNYQLLWYSENYTNIDSYTDENGEFTVELPFGNYRALNGSYKEIVGIDVRGDMSGVVINA